MFYDESRPVTEGLLEQGGVTVNFGIVYDFIQGGLEDRLDIAGKYFKRA